MIKVKLHSKISLAESLKSHTEEKLTLKINGIKGKEIIYLKVIEDNLSQLIHLTDLSIVIKQSCILFDKGFTSLAAAVSCLTKLSSLSVVVQGQCLIEGGELNALTRSIEKLNQLRKLKVHIQVFNKVTAFSLEQFICSLKLHRDLESLDIEFYDVYYYQDSNTTHQSIWKNFHYLESLQNLRFNICFQRREDIIELFDQIKRLKLLEHLEVDYFQIHYNHLWWFDNMATTVDELKNLKSVTVKAQDFDPTHIYIKEDHLKKFLQSLSKLEKFETFKLDSFLFGQICHESYELVLQKLNNLNHLKILTDKALPLYSLKNRSNLQVLEINFKDKQISDDFIQTLSLSFPSFQNLKELSLYLPCKINKSEDELLAAALLQLQNLKKLDCSIDVDGEDDNFFTSIRRLEALENLSLRSTQSMHQFQITMESINHLKDLERLFIDIKNASKKQNSNQFRGFLNNQKMKTVEMHLPETMMVGLHNEENNEQEKSSNCSIEKLLFKINYEWFIIDNEQYRPPNFSFLKHCSNLIELNLQIWDMKKESSLQGLFKHLVNIQKLKINNLRCRSYFELIEIFKEFQCMKRLNNLVICIKQLDGAEHPNESLEDQIEQTFSSFTNLKKLDLQFGSDKLVLCFLLSGVKQLRNLSKLAIEGSLSDEDIPKLQQSLQNKDNLQHLSLKFGSELLKYDQSIQNLQSGFSNLKKLKFLFVEIRNFNFHFNGLIQQTLSNYSFLETAQLQNRFLNPHDRNESLSVYTDQINENESVDTQNKDKEEMLNIETNEGDLCHLEENQDELERNNSNTTLQSLTLELQFSENQQTQDSVNKILKEITRQTILSQLTLRIIGALKDCGCCKSTLFSELDFFSLNRLTDLVLILQDIHIQDDQKQKIQNSSDFFRSLKYLKLVLGDNINFTSSLLEGIKHSKNLDYLIIYSSLTSESAEILGRSLKQLSQLKYVELFKLEYQKENFINYNAMNQLTQGIGNLSNASYLHITLESKEEIQDEKQMIREMLVLNQNISSLQLIINLDYQCQHSVATQVISSLNSLPYLSEIIIQLNEKNTLSQEMLNEFISTRIRKFKLLTKFELKATYSDSTLVIDNRISKFEEASQKELSSNKIYLSVSDSDFKLRQGIFSLNLSLPYQQMTEINLSFLLENEDFRQFHIYNKDVHFLHLLLENLKYVSSTIFQITIPLYQSNIEILNYLLQLIPYLRHVQKLDFDISTQDDIGSASWLRIAECLAQLDKLKCLNFTSGYNSLKVIQVRNLIIKNAQKLIMF